eukprot:1371321-Amphidinium_carterae.1
MIALQVAQSSRWLELESWQSSQSSSRESSWLGCLRKGLREESHVQQGPLLRHVLGCDVQRRDKALEDAVC